MPNQCIFGWLCYFEDVLGFIASLTTIVQNDLNFLGISIHNMNSAFEHWPAVSVSVFHFERDNYKKLRSFFSCTYTFYRTIFFHINSMSGGGSLQLLSKSILLTFIYFIIQIMCFNKTLTIMRT